VEPKSFRSRRMVCLSNLAIEALGEQRLRSGGELVFANQCGEPPESSSVTDALNVALKRAGWAVGTLGGDPIVCHTAAAAATRALAEGSNRASAEAAARSAAPSETALRETRAGYDAGHAY